jgi:hypothetical protein
MSAQRNKSTIRSALARLVYGSGLPIEKMEHCDGCRRMFPLRSVELIGPQILCPDCVPSEFSTTLHPHLPAHPRLLDRRADVRV